MYFYLIIAFQIFCIYHLFKNRNSYYWILAIVFLPFIGCVTYLVTQVLTKRDTKNFQENLTTIVDPSHRVKGFERKFEFAETYLNRVNLADAYLASHNYNKAIDHYVKALEDKTQNDFYVKESLIKSYYYSKDYDQVIDISESLENHKDFEKSDLPFLFGMALAEKGRDADAEIQLRSIDRPYSNYNERLAFVKFLLSVDKTNDAKEIIQELYVETQNMTKMNRGVYRATIAEIEKLKNSL